MRIAMSKTREQYPLSPKKITKKTLKVVLGWVIFFGVMYVGAYFVLDAAEIATAGYYKGLVTLGFFVLLLVIIVPTYFYQRWYFAVYFYDLTPDFIQIKKGPITPLEITLPYERIQDVYVDQDLLDRLFGLYDVHLSSATISSGVEAHIDGVEKQAAEGLRGILLETIKQRISKNRAVNPQTNNPIS